jgi:RNA polymerase sigma factor (sigma-70 family)
MSMSDPDLVLLERYREQGDAEAFTEIVHRYAGPVFAACQRVLHDPSVAEDAAQETFYRLMTRPHRVSSSLGGWLHRAATRLALDIRRSDSSRRRREGAYEVPQPPEASTWADVAPKLDEAMAVLPDDQRELLVRHFMRGEAQAQLADEAHVSAATMSRRIKSAIDALRQELMTSGLCVTPALLWTLLGQHGSIPVSGAQQICFGKLLLYCSARNAASPPVSITSMLRNWPQMLYRARWAAAALGLSLAIMSIAAITFRRVHTPRPMPDATPVRVAQSNAMEPGHISSGTRAPAVRGTNTR